jgi:predicted permease
MSTLAREIRFALRNLRKSPGTTLLAVVVLALGIGGNSAMFHIVSSLLFRPVGYPEPERLMAVLSRDTETGDRRGVSYANYLDLRAASTSFENLAAYNLSMVGIGDGEETRRAFGDMVTANYFDAFGINPHRGRFLRPEEESSDARVAVLSYGLWERRGGREDAVGSSLVLNGIPYTVIGVAPPGFGGTSIVIAPDLWVPIDSAENLANDYELDAGRALDDRASHTFSVVGRLRDGVEREQANADTARVAAALASSFPRVNEHYTFSVHPISRIAGSASPETDASMARLSMLLVSMATVLLLVAGLNLATLQSARSVARRREIAVRFALGSGRLQVVRQLLIESLLIALAAGGIGLIVAWGGPRLLLASAERFVPFQIMLRADLDWRVVVATVGFCVLAALFVGLLPALRAMRPTLAADLAEKVEGGAARRGRLLARADLPVLCEIALSMVLLVAAGLFLRGALAAGNVDPGFELDRLAMVEIDPSLVGYDETRGRELILRLEERLAAIPGVRSAASAGTVPFGLISLRESVAASEAGAAPEREDRVDIRFNVAGPGYFETMGVPVLRGRTFLPTEAAAVAVVDERLAERLWPDADALGRRLRLLSVESDELAELEVVGVVGEISESLLERDPLPQMWLSNRFRYMANSHLHLRFESPPDVETLGRVRAAIREVDAHLPVLALRAMRTHLESSFGIWALRAASRLFAVFAAVALLLTLVGVYGVRAYSVARRSREIGIRMALGSSVGDTLRMILREGMVVALVGSAVGLLLASGVARLLAGFLYEVSPSDPLVFGLSFALLFGVALLACLGPARRAARVDPLVALRTE